MTDILPPRSFSFDYYSSPEVKWSDGQRTFAREYSFNAQNVIRAGAGIPPPISPPMLVPAATSIGM